MVEISNYADKLRKGCGCHGNIISVSYMLMHQYSSCLPMDAISSHSCKTVTYLQVSWTQRGLAQGSSTGMPLSVALIEQIANDLKLEQNAWAHPVGFEGCL